MSHNQIPLHFENKCSISEFLNCVFNSCETLQKSQIEILHYFKNNVIVLKAYVDVCFDKIVSHEQKLEGKSEQKASYRNNVVIHGLVNEDLRVKEKQASFIKSFFISALGVNVNIEAVEVKQSRNSSFVAIVTLLSRKEKAIVFRNCHRLKNYGQKISITDDRRAAAYSTCSSSDELESNCSQDIIKRSTNFVTEQVIPESMSKENSQPSREKEICNLQSSQSKATTTNTTLVDADTGFFEEFEKRFIKALDKTIKVTETVTAPVKEEVQINETPPDFSHTNILLEFKPVKKKTKQFLKSIKKEGKLSEEDVHIIFQLHEEQNRVMKSKRECICGTFHVLPRRFVEKELEILLEDTYVAKHENLLKYAKSKWDEHFQHDYKMCFCQFMLRKTE